MSAWPQAVWIVKKFQQKSQIESIINQFNDTVDVINEDIDNQISKIDELQQQINSISTGTIFISTALPPEVDSELQPIHYAENSICFIYDEQ